MHFGAPTGAPTAVPAAVPAVLPPAVAATYPHLAQGPAQRPVDRNQVIATVKSMMGENCYEDRVPVENNLLNFLLGPPENFRNRKLFWKIEGLNMLPLLKELQLNGKSALSRDMELRFLRDGAGKLSAELTSSNHFCASFDDKVLRISFFGVSRSTAMNKQTSSKEEQAKQVLMSAEDDSASPAKTAPNLSIIHNEIFHKEVALKKVTEEQLKSALQIAEPTLIVRAGLQMTPKLENALLAQHEGSEIYQKALITLEAARQEDLLDLPLTIDASPQYFRIVIEAQLSFLSFWPVERMTQHLIEKSMDQSIHARAREYFEQKLNKLLTPETIIPAGKA